MLFSDPALREYWTYEGSLTSPPCYENVQWIIFRYPLTISHVQVNFRFMRYFDRNLTIKGRNIITKNPPPAKIFKVCFTVNFSVAVLRIHVDNVNCVVTCIVSFARKLLLWKGLLYGPILDGLTEI